MPVAGVDSLNEYSGNVPPVDSGPSSSSNDRIGNPSSDCGGVGTAQVENASGAESAYTVCNCGEAWGVIHCRPSEATGIDEISASSD